MWEMHGNNDKVMFWSQLAVHLQHSTSIRSTRSAKVLGVTLRDDLKWNDHVNNITAKASQRIYLLKLLTVYISFNFIVRVYALS